MRKSETVQIPELGPEVEMWAEGHEDGRTAVIVYDHATESRCVIKWTGGTDWEDDGDEVDGPRGRELYGWWGATSRATELTETLTDAVVYEVTP